MHYFCSQYWLISANPFQEQRRYSPKKELDRLFEGMNCYTDIFSFKITVIPEAKLIYISNKVLGKIAIQS